MDSSGRFGLVDLKHADCAERGKTSGFFFAWLQRVPHASKRVATRHARESPDASTVSAKVSSLCGLIIRAAYQSCDIIKVLFASLYAGFQQKC